MKKWIGRLLYPPKCIVCGALVENDRFSVCDTCLEALTYNKRACRICGSPLDTVYGELVCIGCRRRKRAFSRGYVPFVYKDAVREAVLRFKFKGKRGSCRTLAAFILMKMRELEAERPDLITYVPLHFIRLGTRGYNQAALLAEELGKMMNVPVRPTLRKIKHTLPQSKKKGRERLYALRDAFALRKNAEVSGKRILLMDDVVTTGTTLHTCARVLRTAGAAEIQIAAVAATPFYVK